MGFPEMSGVAWTDIHFVRLMVILKIDIYLDHFYSQLSYMLICVIVFRFVNNIVIYTHTGH